MINRRTILVLLLIALLLSVGCSQNTIKEPINESNEEKTINTEESKDEKLEKNDENESTKKNDTLKPIQVDEHWGYENNSGDIIISPEFDAAKEFSEGLAAVKMRGKWVFIDTKGKVVINHRFDDVTSFDNGISKVEVYDHNGKINKDGEFIVDKNSDVIPKKMGDYFWGFVTEDDDKIVVYPKFKKIYEYSEGLALARIVDTNNKCGYINRSGEIVIGPKFDYGKPFKNKKALVRKDKRWGLINILGDVVVEFQFDDAAYYRDNLIKVLTNGKMGVIKDSGEVVLDCEYDAVEYHQDHLYKIKQNGKWGLIDNNEEIQIKPQLKILKSFFEDRAVIKLNSQWGYINPDGEIIIEPQYDYAFPFNDNQAKVIKDNQYGYINKEGQLIENYKKIESFEEYDSLEFDNLDEMLTVINTFIPVVDQSTADQMIKDLISKNKLKNTPKTFYDNNLEDLSYHKVRTAIFEASSIARENQPNVFDDSPGIYYSEKNTILKYIDNKRIKEHLTQFFNNYYGISFSEGDLSKEVDYKHIQHKFGEYLSDDFNDRLIISGENVSRPIFIETVPAISVDELADRLLNYEKLMQKYAKESKSIRVLKNGYMYGMYALLHHNKGTPYLNEYYQATYDYRMALDRLWKNKEAEVTSIAARDMLDFIYSREDFVVRTYRDSEAMDENYEKIKEKISKLIDEKYSQ